MAMVDAHQHFWDPAVTEFGWMTEAHAPIRRRFGPEDLRPALVENGVEATVLVQTWHSVEETREFLAIFRRACRLRRRRHRLGRPDRSGG